MEEKSIDYHEGWKDGFKQAMLEVSENVKLRAKECEESFKFYKKENENGK